MTEQRLAAAIAVLAAVGMCRGLWLHLVSEPRNDFRRERIDPRFERIKTLLPREGEVGYVSDEPAATGPSGVDAASAGTRMFEQAQYALAPLILRYDDTRAAVVVANLGDPSHLPEITAKNGLAVVAAAGPGLAVLRPR
ncbi:MAG: hypothetical protein ABR567_13150 [Myxococcales bacterium]|nr:hypothetical protein [Myxococcales bacterium]